MGHGGVWRTRKVHPAQPQGEKEIALEGGVGGEGHRGPFQPPPPSLPAVSGGGGVWHGRCPTCCAGGGGGDPNTYGST